MTRTVDAAPQASAALRLWATVPPELIEKLRPLAGPLIQDVLLAIQHDVPAYALLAPHARCRQRLLDTIRAAILPYFDASAGRTAGPDWCTEFRQVGRTEFAEGRPVEPVRAAIRVGARVAWQYIRQRGPAIGIPPETLFTAAEAIFAWADELGEAVLAGYDTARTAHPRTDSAPEQVRRRLMLAILSPHPGAPDPVPALARAAAWPVPDRLVAIAIRRRSGRDELTELAAQPGVLLDRDIAPACALLPDPGGDRRFAADLLGRRLAAVGPPVAVAAASRSLDLARRLLTMVETTGSRERVVWCEDHLPSLLLHADPVLTTHLREHAEALFAELTPKQRHRMAVTLLVWLQTRGTAGELAARLDVHPQTVRYRIRRLTQLLGDKLSDPNARLTIELALRATMLPERETTPAVAPDESPGPLPLSRKPVSAARG